jgi:protocatechuate 3,4-dioxygenase beta subunit
VSCVLTPELTEGPYYLDLDLVRSDITEGRPGVPLDLTLVVADATTCTAIADAVVDIWHTDAAGTYSGVEGDPGTFMRGSQLTDLSGAATFRTIYPGWYGGRPVHVHVMVHVGGDAVHTGQLFFDDELSDEVFSRAPYDTRPERDTRNADDGIYARGGTLTTLALEAAGDGYLGRLVLGVER